MTYDRQAYGDLPHVMAIIAHPITSTQSVTRSLFEHALTVISERATVDVCDLYAEGFSPLLTPAERMAYEDPHSLSPDLIGYRDRLLRADAIIMAYPTWVGGPPAILKALFERLFKPGVTFTIDDHRRFQSLPTFHHIRSALIMNPHGGSFLSAQWMGAYGRKFGTRELRASIGPQLRVRYNGFYRIDRLTSTEMARYEARVAQSARFLMASLLASALLAPVKSSSL